MMNIKKLRTAKKMSQIEFGALCGVSQAVVSQWETEIALPRTRQLPYIANVLGCSINDLFELESSLDSPMSKS